MTSTLWWRKVRAGAVTSPPWSSRRACYLGSNALSTLRHAQRSSRSRPPTDHSRATDASRCRPSQWSSFRGKAAEHHLTLACETATVEVSNSGSVVAAQLTLDLSTERRGNMADLDAD